jgi:predicted  nucleic acid-binding Zn-ribbon protein
MDASNGGITVTKFVNSAEEQSRDGVVVTFRIESERSDDATVRLVDDCLEDEAMARGVTFREEHDPENWSVEDGQLAWSRRVNGGGQLLTGYDVHPDALDGVALDAAPELASVETAHPVLHAGDGGETVAETDAGSDTAAGAQQSRDEGDDSQTVEPHEEADDEPTAEPDDHVDRGAEPVAEDADRDDEPSEAADDGTTDGAIRRALTGGLDDSDTPSLYHLHVETVSEATAEDVERVLRSLENAFYMLGSDPTPAALRNGSFDRTLDLVVGARLDTDTVRRAVATLDPVSAVELTQVDETVVEELDPAALVMAAGDAGCGSDDAGERFASLASELESGFSGEFESTTPEAPSETTTLDMTWDEFSVEPGAEDARAESGSPRASADRPRSDDGRLLDELVAELQTGVPERQRTALRRALGVGPEPSVAVRLRYLSGRVSDLAAYADAIEEFIDEEGTAQQVLSELDDRLDSLEAEHEELTDTLDRVEGDLGDTEATVDDLGDSLESVEETVGELEASLQEEHERVEANHDAIDAQGQKVEENRAAIEANADSIDEGERNIALNARDIQRNAAGVEENADAIAETEAAVVELREEECAAIVERLDRLESAVEDNTEWRERMRSAFDTPGE